MATTSNQIVKARSAGGRTAVPVAATIKIPQGTLVFVIAASGFATNAIAAGANHFIGVAVAEADNTNGADAAINVEVYTKGQFALPGASLTQAMVGDKIYAVDNFAVNATATSQTLIGRAVKFNSATELEVDLEVGVQA